MKMRKEKIRLGVNIDHMATLRKVRGNTTSYPDLLHLSQLAAKGGADQITIHLREDRRHIQDMDVKKICSHSLIDVNLEMACTEEMTRIALKNKPQWVCLVPENRAELTTEGGLDVEAAKNKIKKVIDKIQNKGIEVSLFIEPNLRHVQLAFDLGADAIEFHTGKWVRLVQKNQKRNEFNKLKKAAQRCHQLGMRVHAGHGLDLEHTQLIKNLPYLKELNIGHSIICFSLEQGIEKTVRRFKSILK